MRYTIPTYIILLSAILLSSGCSTINCDIGSIAGTNLQDLKRARSEGISRISEVSLSEAFDDTSDILREKGLVIYQSSKKAGYIVFMGLARQNNTTRIGVFFESLDANKTKITISSLSSSALKQAESILFTSLR